MDNRLAITMKTFGHIISINYAKQPLGPMWLWVTCLWANLGFEKIEKIIHIYNEAHEKVDELFQFAYAEAVSLAHKFDIEKEWSQSCVLQINCNLISSEKIKENLQISVYFLFLILYLLKWNLIQVRKEDALWTMRVDSWAVPISMSCSNKCLKEKWNRVLSLQHNSIVN